MEYLSGFLIGVAIVIIVCVVALTIVGVNKGEDE